MIRTRAVDWRTDLPEREADVLESFLLTAGLIFVAELGDKSQLLALWLATRYRWWLVLGGLIAAAGLLQLLAVAAGRVLEALIPQDVLLVIAGLSFFAFAAWSLRGDPDEDEEQDARTARGPLATLGIVAAAFLVSEFGDKTQLATVAIAAREPSFVGVWLGAVAGLTLSSGIAIAVGTLVGKRLPIRLISRVAAALFVVFGVLTIAEAFR